MTPRSVLLVVLLAVTMQAGCGSSPQAKFYTLSSVATPERAERAFLYSVSIRAVTVPEIVDRPQFVLRTGANQVTIDEFTRWAEPLKSEIPRVIAENLRLLLNGASVSAYPQNADAEPDYQVYVDVQRFDSVLSDAATIEVLWTVRPRSGNEPRSGRSIAREPWAGQGYDGLVAAHGRAVAAISREIAAAILATRQNNGR